MVRELVLDFTEGDDCPALTLGEVGMLLTMLDQFASLFFCLCFGFEVRALHRFLMEQSLGGQLDGFAFHGTV